MDFNRLLNQDITYWKNLGTDSDRNESFSIPIVIKGRWEKKITKKMDEDREELFSRNQVWTSEEVFDSDYLALGDETVELNPQNLEGEHWIEVKDILKTPSVEGGQILYKALG